MKHNSDLLVLWSDVYHLTDDHRVELAPNRHVGPPRRPPLVYLDNRYYQLIDDLYRRFPHGAPSLVQCTELHVEGDVYFGAGVVIEGNVHIIHCGAQPMHIPDGAHLVDSVYRS